MNATTLVLGGTGKTGARIVERLTARGVDVRVGSRSAEVPFDWTDRSTWTAALAGVGRVYVSYYPDLAIPGAVDAVAALTEAARDAGVQRLVLLSGRGEEEAQAAEQVVQRSGLEWTIVRCAWFNQNFDENYLLEPVLAGEVALPAGDVPEPFVDADDIADVAVAALTEDRHVGELYELTGPRLLTFAEAVAEIAKATGREIAFVPVPLDDYSAALEAEGLPSDLAWLIGYLFREVLDGRNASLADGVQRALGRAPKDFSDYARDTAATGVWNA
ncbi:NAD(P)H-binding protein [Jiangella rhizosphaerae]|uniref:NmrA family transcriptional regulator n=1 Tax=Jiangella rhizosphaerae TaxID=2293569 RepID=A0A418KJC7_9ACTN|nr:NAD(P)H-binding protein [Jiangella rhizosphaerae]RIQ14469.1 NmrA family transcriptional regulator [Jiangella rhizosphaerae]